MTRSQRQTLFSVAVAVTAHLTLVAAMRTYVVHLPPERPVAAPSVRVTETPAIVRLDPPPQTPLPPPPKSIDQLGEESGKGESIASVDLPEITAGPRPEAFEQAWTRQKPSFAAPSQSTPAQTDQEAADKTTEERDATQQIFGPTSVSGLVSFAVPKDAQQETPNEKDVRLDDHAQEAQARAEAAPEQTSADEPTANAGTPDDRPPDPATQGPSDLDAFAMHESAVFTLGGIEAATGRPTKLVRPRIDLGFRADATVLPGRRLAVRVFIITDSDGKPRDVTVLDSSGSHLIDDAVRLALYDSWFGGKMPDAFDFTVAFYR